MRPEREQLIRSLFDEYIEMYASRDDRLTTRFSENFSGYAGSSDLLVKDRDEWVNVTRLDFSQVPGRVDIEVLDLSLQDLGNDVVAVRNGNISRNTTPRKKIGTLTPTREKSVHR